MTTRTLTTTLPSDTLYVSGMVNGVATTWTNISDNVWQTVAERSATDTYVVELTIINTLGVATETTFTLYYGLQLVTDRKLSDVLACNAKGTYNATDLNRVGAAMLYVADRLIAIGYSPRINVKLDWSLTDFPTVTDMQQYLSNLAELKSQFKQSTTTPKIPDDMDNFTWEEANNIEKILEDIDSLISNIMLAWFYSNEIYSGEV